MSEKDFDWNDDLDFESLADERDMEANYGEPGDSFADFEDLADYADSPEGDSDQGVKQAVSDFAAPAAAGQSDKPEDPLEEIPHGARSAGRVPVKPQNVVSPKFLGLLVASCTLVGALGLAGALLVGFGLDPLALWDPAGFSSLDSLVNFQEHPLNIFYLVSLGIVLLTFLGASAATRLAGKANAQVHRSESLLSRVTALRLDDEMPWTSAEFKNDPDTSAFVTDILGAWRLQQARQVKSVGLEGELRRLEKALRDNSREDLSDRYDHPLVGSMADAMLGWYDDRDSARKEANAIRAKDEIESGEIMSLIEDARSWNSANGERVDVQSATLQRWSTRFQDLAARFEKESGQSEAIAGLQGLQKDLSRALQGESSKPSASLDDLVDRGSKLAFQIAMEVARLGPRGERLLPMSQSLEELTTQFRQAVNKAKAGGQDDVANPQAVLTRLQQITVQLLKEGPGGAGSLVRTLHDLSPASQKVAQNLDEISGSFEQQAARLNNLGTSFAGLTGLPFDPESVCETAPSNPPEGGLNITHNDPFGRDQRQPEAQFQVDPFGASDDPLTAPVENLQDSGITTDVTPGKEDAFQVEAFDSGLELVSDLVPDGPSEPDLSFEEETVYDLREFGAVRIDQQSDQAAYSDDEDRVYDLAEFGAVALN